MKDDVKACVNSRLDFINNYLDVTLSIKLNVISL